MTLKKCDRCSASFECKVNDIQHCFCTTLHLSEATKAYLSKKHHDCLCEKCLKEIGNLEKTTQK